MDPQILRSVVKEDLQHIRKYWDWSTSEDNLRITSPILRKLLIDGCLQRAWTVMGLERQPTLIGTTLAPLLKVVPKICLELANSGGANTGPTGISNGVLEIDSEKLIPLKNVPGLVSDGKLIAPSFLNTPRQAPQEVRMTLKEFIESPCLVVNGVVVSRRVLIIYVSNRLGGVHVGTRSGKYKKEFETLDSVRKESRYKKAMYFELLSAAEVLLRSSDIVRLESLLAQEISPNETT